MHSVMLGRVRGYIICTRQPAPSVSHRSKRRMESYSTRTYKDAVAKLFTLQSNVSVIQQWQRERRDNLQLDLIAEMQVFMQAVGVDVDRLSKKSIHVAGTKGKGTTCAIAESIIRHHGYTTGLYTSPHLVSIRERIKLNGEAISEELFTKYFWVCWDALELALRAHPSLSLPGWFKYLTIMAYKVFQEEKVDCAVIEVGIGGRTDATNVLPTPACCGITLLDYDHVEVLGNTLSEIAYEKSGIFKHGVPAVTVPQAEEAMQKLISRSHDLNAPLFSISPCKSYLATSNVTGDLGMSASYSQTNAALALALSQLWLNKNGTDPSHKREIVSTEAGEPFPVFGLSASFLDGIRNYHWPGRAQILDMPEYHKKLYLDGAHTPESAAAALNWFMQNRSTTAPACIIFHCNKPRIPKTLLTPLRRAIFSDKLLVSHIFFTYPNATSDPTKQDDLSWQHAMATSWNEMTAEIDTNGHLIPKIQVLPSIASAMDAVKQDCDGVVDVMITGSLYLVGAALEYMKYPTESKR